MIYFIWLDSYKYYESNHNKTSKSSKPFQQLHEYSKGNTRPWTPRERQTETQWIGWCSNERSAVVQGVFLEWGLRRATLLPLATNRWQTGGKICSNEEELIRKPKTWSFKTIGLRCNSTPPGIHLELRVLTLGFDKTTQLLTSVDPSAAFLPNSHQHSTKLYTALSSTVPINKLLSANSVLRDL